MKTNVQFESVAGFDRLWMQKIEAWCIYWEVNVRNSMRFGLKNVNS